MIKALNYLITALACNKFWPAIQDHSIAATIVNTKYVKPKLPHIKHFINW
jgi:hypothetical protein